MNGSCLEPRADDILEHASKTRTKKDVLRLMPLGGSITYGVGSSDGTGYRKSLLELLQRYGIHARMVGSRKDGSMPNNDHEGWRGFRIDQIKSKARKSVERVCPDIFMVNAGSNDCLQSFEIDKAGKRVGNMLDYLWFACPDSTVLLSTLLINADKHTNSTVISFNEQYRALAKQKLFEGKRIILVDMYPSEEPDIRGLYDGIHPDNENYDKMSRLWFRGIQEAIQKGFIHGAQHKH